MYYPNLPKKAILKARKELLDLHKRVLKTYLVGKGLKFSVRHKFFSLYDHFIDEENIEQYYYLPAWYFVESLILYELKNLDWQPTKKQVKHAKRKGKLYTCKVNRNTLLHE